MTTYSNTGSPLIIDPAAAADYIKADAARVYPFNATQIVVPQWAGESVWGLFSSAPARDRDADARHTARCVRRARQFWRLKRKRRRGRRGERQPTAEVLWGAIVAARTRQEG
jgi:hypothetical protein